MPPSWSRRRALQLGASTLAAVLAGCSTDPDAEVTSTGTPGVEPTETSTETATTTPGSAAVRWRFETGAMISSPPVVDGGRIHVGTTVTDGPIPTASRSTPAAGEHTLFALRPRDGAARWRLQFADPILSLAATPDAALVVDGRVGIHDGYEHTLTAVTDSGSERWHVDAMNPGSFFATTVRSDAVVVGVSAGNAGGGAASYDLTDGSAGWQTLLDVGAGSANLFGVHVGTDLVFVEDAGRLIALDIHTGETRWEVPFELEEPVNVWGESEDLVFVEHPVADRVDAVTALSKDGGGNRWEFTAPLNEPISGVVHAGDSVLLGTWRGRVIELDAASGDQRWEASLGGNASTAVYKVSSIEPESSGSIYAGVLDRGVVALDPEAGDIRWEFPFESPVEIAQGEELYVRDGRRQLLALNPDTGEERWRFSARSDLTRPGVAMGSAFVGTDRGAVYRLG